MTTKSLGVLGRLGIRRRIAATARPTRIRLAKWLDPGPAPSESWDFFIKEPLRCATELRETLPINEEMYLHTAGQAVGDARGFVIYTALDEVVKASLWLMRMQDLVQGERTDPRAGVIERLLLAQLAEERSGRVRRLLELLAVLINFSETDEQEYYRYLLALELLEDSVSADRDLRDFWNCQSANIRATIRHQVSWLHQIESRLELERCWFRNDSHAVPDPDKLRPGRVFSSTRARILRAFPRMTKNERMLFGFSYGASYGQASQRIHYSAEQMDYRLSADDDPSRHHHLGFLCFAVLSRCDALLGKPDLPHVRRMMEILAATDANEMFAQTTRREKIAVGDFVLAYGDLAEVLEILESSHGYQAFRVRYLAERPMSEIAEDTFPAIYVQLFYTRAHALEHMQVMVTQGKLPPQIVERMQGMSPEELQPILAATLTEVWRLGLGDWVRGERDRRAEQRRTHGKKPG